MIMVFCSMGMSCEYLGGQDDPNGYPDPGDDIDSEFSSFYYYEPEKESRYQAYAEEKPKLSADEVVWRVNAEIDNKAYKNSIESSAPETITALVGKHINLPKDYEPDDLVDIDRTKMRKDAAAALEVLKEAAAKEELTIIAQSGYRSFSRQKELYEAYSKDDPKGADKYSAKPGYSEHQTGLAVDVNYDDVGNRDFVGTKEAKWVLKNSWKYGFIVRYTDDNRKITGYESEPWHLRYIGKDNSERMHNEGFESFEEYWVKFVRTMPPDA